MYSWACKYEMVHCESMTTFLPMVSMATRWSQIFDAVNQAEITIRQGKKTTTKKYVNLGLKWIEQQHLKKKLPFLLMTKNIQLDHNASVYSLWNFFRQSAGSDWLSSGWPLEHCWCVQSFLPPIFACCCVFAVQCTHVPPLTSREMNGEREKRCVCLCDYNGLRFGCCVHI